MPPMHKADPEQRNEGSKRKPYGAWRHILMWTMFGLTLVITIVIVVQTILRTTGFA